MYRCRCYLRESTVSPVLSCSRDVQIRDEHYLCPLLKPLVQLVYPDVGLGVEGSVPSVEGGEGRGEEWVSCHLAFLDILYMRMEGCNTITLPMQGLGGEGLALQPTTLNLHKSSFLGECSFITPG